MITSNDTRISLINLLIVETIDPPMILVTIWDISMKMRFVLYCKINKIKKSLIFLNCLIKKYFYIAAQSTKENAALNNTFLRDTLYVHVCMYIVCTWSMCLNCIFFLFSLNRPSIIREPRLYPQFIYSHWSASYILPIDVKYKFVFSIWYTSTTLCKAKFIFSI